MKILLANPPCIIPIDDVSERFFVRAGSRWPYSGVRKKGEKPTYSPFPFYLAYASALLQKEGFDVSVIDGVTLNMSEKEFLDAVLRESPDLLLFETATPTFAKDVSLSQSIRKLIPSVKIAFAGAHVTVFPKDALAIDAIDFILLNEYELSLLELSRRIKKNQSFEGIDGIGYRKDNEIVVSPSKGVLDISKLPFPDRDNFPQTGKGDLNAYWDGFCTFRPAAQMHASRGCPFRCNFCLWNHAVYQCGPYRVFSPSYVVDEMELLIKKGAREIYFDDDTFTGSKKHVLELCSEIKKRIPNARFSLMGDFMVTDEEMLDALKSAGCIAMKFGVESAVPEILKSIGKPVDLEKVKRLAKYAGRIGIRTHATFTFGLFGETRETMEETLRFAKELDVDTVQFSINTPFPGTPYFRVAKERNLLLSEEWDRFDGGSSAVIRFEHFASGEVESFYAKAWDEWFRAKRSDPKWLLRQAGHAIDLIRGRGIRDYARMVLRVLRA